MLFMYFLQDNLKSKNKDNYHPQLLTGFLSKK